MNEYHLGLTLAADNINDLSKSAMLELDSNGYRYESDKGEVVMHPRVSLILEDPRQRSLNIENRKSNIYQLIAESLWVTSGSDVVSGFLSIFLPRALNFSDDGENWRGAYGGRLFKLNNSFKSAIEQVADLIVESPMTRQAWLPIFDPNLDLPDSLKQVYGLDFSKDIPCNVGMNFWVSPWDNKLNVDVIQRSGDIFWGTGSINLFEFSFIQELVLAHINERRLHNEPPLELGTYCQRVTNLHYYPGNIGTQMEDIKRVQTPCTELRDTGSVKPRSLLEFSRISCDVVNMCEEISSLEGSSYAIEVNEMVEDYLNLDGDGTESPDTFDLYVAITLQYIVNRYFPEIPIFLREDMFGEHQALLASIKASGYTKFDLIK